MRAAVECRNGRNESGVAVTRLGESLVGGSPMDGFLPMDDDSAAARARRFREKAEEIRRAARLANSLDIVRELLETAFHFDNMAARVEKRC